MHWQGGIELRIVTQVKGHFFVPHYQRGYRWRDEVTTLLDDLEACGEHRYCLQPVVVRRRDDGAWELVDGQQRLTTLYLVLRYLKKTHLPSIEIPYSITYETRPRSAGYLDAPTPEEASTNVDFFHIHAAAERIRAWFGSHPNAAVAAMELYRKPPGNDVVVRSRRASHGAARGVTLNRPRRPSRPSPSGLRSRTTPRA